MLSLTRRQLLIGGLAGFAVPFVSLASPAERLILSGRVLTVDGKPLADASFAIGKDRVTTDADGRFVLVTDTGAYPVSKAQRDHQGTWRATIGIAL